MIYAATQPLYELTVPISLLLIVCIVLGLIGLIWYCACVTGSADDDRADRDNLAAEQELTER